MVKKKTSKRKTNLKSKSRSIKKSVRKKSARKAPIKKSVKKKSSSISRKKTKKPNKKSSKSDDLPLHERDLQVELILLHHSLQKSVNELQEIIQTLPSTKMKKKLIENMKKLQIKKEYHSKKVIDYLT